MVERLKTQTQTDVGSRFKVQGLGFRVFRVQGLGSRGHKVKRVGTSGGEYTGIVVFSTCLNTSNSSHNVIQSEYFVNTLITATQSQSS